VIGTHPETAALGSLRADGAALRKQPSLVPIPIGTLPHPQPSHAMPSMAAPKRNGFDLRSGDAQPRSIYAMDGSFARDVLKKVRA